MPRGSDERFGASPLGAAFAVVQVLVFVAYPFAVYYAHTWLATRALGIVLLVVLAGGLVFRLRGNVGELRGIVVQHAGIFALVVTAIVTDERALLLALPAVVSLYLLATFGMSLRRGPPMIERFARIIEDDLPPFTLPYCRSVTIVWCVFFAANAAVVCTLAFAAPVGWWALYTGALFYAVLGVLMAREFVLRKVWFRYYTGTLVDRVLASLFPAEASDRGRRSLSYVAERERRSKSG